MSDDLIKRSDAIDAVMNTEPVFAVDSLEPYQKTKDVVEALEAIPSADRPQGEWIKHEHGFWTFVNDKGERDGWIPDYECNLCGSRAWRFKTNFCGNCGAQMKGADDETD